MTETTQLIQLLQQQIASQESRHQQQMELMQQQVQALVTQAGKTMAPVTQPPAAAATPSFTPFDSTSELWADYWARFCTFAGANSVPDDKKAQVFLTNQSAATYKMLSNLAAQQTPTKDINQLTMEEIVSFMKSQFDPKRFTVRERFKFWSDLQRKPGETIQELAARIRQDAATCDFASIQDPQDEALRTRFICSINNEAVLKALFKIKDDELDFARAIQIAIEVEDAAKVAKETVYGSKPKLVNKVHHLKASPQHRKPGRTSKPAIKECDRQASPCGRCGQKDHKAFTCPYKSFECNYCHLKGHLEAACRKKQRQARRNQVKHISESEKCEVLHAVSRGAGIPLPRLEVPVKVKGLTYEAELDTGAGKSFITEELWHELGTPPLQETRIPYASASQHSMPVLGEFVGSASSPVAEKDCDIRLIVTTVPGLNLLGREAIVAMGISVDEALKKARRNPSVVEKISDGLQPNIKLKERCRKLAENFSELFKPELGCLQGVELNVRFKPEAEPVFHKPRPVPLALQEELAQVYDSGIAGGIWKPVAFNDYGTPVVPIKKALLPGQAKAALRVCGDYSGTVNPQLEPHRQPMPLPEDLLQKLGGGCGFTKIDLADAYNQVKLAPESQRRLALSTHRGVLLQCRLPFGISSAPGYFQEIMEQVTQDLPGVCVYLDDILVSGANPDEHVENLRRLLKRLEEKGFRCRWEKCQFAQPCVEYLGHLLSREGIGKGSKVDAVLKMPAPTDVPGLKAFMGSVQFYGKFLPNLSTIAEPLHRLTQKNTPWQWGTEQQQAFQHLKELLSSDNVLAHFDPALPVGLACDASSVGIGAVLFHRYPDGSERPIRNESKTLTATQRKYSQIQKEAMAIVFGLKKFYQYLYGRHFILVTDHKPLVSLFHPHKATPGLVANRLARWAFLLSQFDYEIEFRKTADHQNADALSRLPMGGDTGFDGEEDDEDVDTVLTISTIGQQLYPADSNALQRESKKDQTLSLVMRYTQEGWPARGESGNEDVEKFRKLENSLTTCNGCLLHGVRVVIPTSLQEAVLGILHLSHLGIQRMKQLARTAVYWPNIDDDIERLGKHCTTCAEHQNKPPKAVVHPWMMPEKPWSRLHLDHAINFMGANWLVMIDAYSKYPCIAQTQSISTKTTVELLERDFAHFGYPHALVTDNAPTFTSGEFQSWCKERGITHLTGAPYHPATNGAAERLVQTFKQALRKSSLPPKAALQEFLMQYRRTPTASGYSPSELLNNRQIRTKIDTLLPSPAHIAQGKQAREAAKALSRETVSRLTTRLTTTYDVGDPCYALYYGQRRDDEPRWVPAVVTKRFGSRTVNVRVHPRGPVWRRHIEQLRPRYTSEEDNEPGEDLSFKSTAPDPAETKQSPRRGKVHQHKKRGASPEYGPGNPRRSKRERKPPLRLGY